jgi:hypothetical protein
MQEKQLFKDYTLQGVVDQLDVIECFEHPGHALRVGVNVKYFRKKNDK